MKHAAILISLLFFAASTFAQQDEPKQSKFNLTLGPEATVFDGPLLEDGRIDYIAALNERDANKVDNQDNAFRALLLLIDPESVDERVAVHLQKSQVLFGVTREEMAAAPKFVDWFDFAEAQGLELDVALAIEEQVVAMDFNHAQIGVFERWLEAQQPALDAAVRACRLPGYRQPIVEDPGFPGSGVMAVDAPYAGFRVIVRSLKYNAYAAIHRGEYEDAVRCALAIRSFASHLQQAPYVINALVGTLYVHYAADVLRELIRHAGVEHEAVATVVRPWLDLPTPVRYHASMKSDEIVFALNGYMAIAAKQVLLDDPEMYLELDDASALLVAIDRIGVDLDALVRRARMYAKAQAELLDAQTYVESIERKKIYDRVWQPRKEAIRDRLLVESDGQVRFRLPKEDLTPAAMGWLIVDLRFALEFDFPLEFDLGRAEFTHIARKAVIDAAVACAGYHNQNGRYPERLADLVPDFLPAEPIDPIDGAPLRYRVDPDGSAVAYSIYTDLEDDGGLTDPSDFAALDEGDYCWPLPAAQR